MRVAVAAGLLAAPGSVALAQSIVDGEVRAVESVAVRDYVSGAPDRPAAHTESVGSAGAEFLRVHFARLHLAPGDYLTVSDPKGRHMEVLTGMGPYGDGRDVWSFAVPGDTALLTLHSGPRGDDGPGADPGLHYGYTVDKLVHGTLPLDADEGGDFPGEAAAGEALSRAVPDPFAPIEPKSLCGATGYTNVACERSAAAAQRPVARLLFVSGGQRSVRCTGWLVRGSNPNTLITNNHCFSTPDAVRATEAQFNHQTTTCTGAAMEPTMSFRGDRLLRTAAGSLDYTLMTLQGNPEATWQELVPSRRAVRLREPIWLIQHPAGLPKKIGVREDPTGAAPCDIDVISGNQIRYLCDTQGGSSGSVVLAAGTMTAIGLHHLGGCPNSATAMAAVCANAEPLLQCSN